MKDYKPKLEEEYPEHLRHLYMAEQQRLNEEEQLNKDRRRERKSVNVLEDPVLSNSGIRTSEIEDHKKTLLNASVNEEPQTSQIERFVICYTCSGTVYTVYCTILRCQDLWFSSCVYRFNCASIIICFILL